MIYSAGHCAERDGRREKERERGERVGEERAKASNARSLYSVI